MTRPDTPIPDDAGLRELAEAATPGPWREGKRRDYDDTRPIAAGQPFTRVPSAFVAHYVSAADAALIVAMRNALPDLLDRLAALTQQEAQVRALLSAVVAYDDANQSDLPLTLLTEIRLAIGALASGRGAAGDEEAGL